MADETTPAPVDNPVIRRVKSKNRRAWFFVFGLVLAAAMLIFSIAPREWFERSSDEESMTEDMGFDDMHGSDPQAQIAALEKMWKEHPDHSPIALMLGNLYFDQGAFVQAASYYREFLRTDTTAAGFEVRLDLSRALFHMNKGDEAVAEIRWILERYPDHPDALYNLGALNANLGKFDDARAAWERLIAKHPDDTLATFAKNALPMLNKPANHP